MVALRNFSASQVNAFNNCQRVWFIQWVLGIKGPQTPAQLRGVEIHTILEHYLRHGEILPAWKIDPSKWEKHELGYERYIEWAKPFLPDPNEPHLAVEQQVFLDTPSGERIDGYHEAAGIPLVGYIDMGRWSLEIPEVWDLKTTSNMRYVKTPAELHKDVQLNTYARWVFQVEPSLNEVKCGHIYVKVEAAGKKAPKTVRSQKVIPVSTTITRESNNEYWARDAATMDEMVTLAGMFDKEGDSDAFLQTIQPNVNFCSSYGGCPHRERCGISVKEEILEPSKGKLSMSFMDKVKARRAAEAKEKSGEAPAPDASEAAAAEAPKPKPKPKAKPAAPAKEKGAALSFKERMAAKKAGESVTPVEVVAEGTSDEPLDSTEAAADAVLPPDAPSRETSEERGEEIRAKAQEKADKKAATKKKKTTTRKTKHKRTLTLYFGCRPAKGEHQAYTLAEDWCHELFQALDEEIREKQSKGYWDLSFAGQKSSLAEAVQARIEAEDVPEVIVCNSGGMVKEITSLLIPFASDTVEAVR
jgi:hypothetical protein